MRKGKRYQTTKKRIRFDRIFMLLSLIILIVCVIKYQLISKAILIIKPILIQNIEIDVNNKELELGESIDISKKIYPENFSKSNLIWHISNNEIIEIQDDRIIAKNPGKAVIYLCDTNDESEIRSNQIEIECLIKIKEITIDNLIQEMKLGEVYTLNTTVIPENATYKDLQYETTNSEILTVNDNGNLIANALREK